MERWSYKPEVEGLSPSLGTKIGRGDTEKGRQGERDLNVPVSPCLSFSPLASRGVTHLGRTLTAGDCGV